MSQFSKRRSLAIIKYRKFVQAGKKQPSVWDKVGHQILLGNQNFIEVSIKKLNRKKLDDEFPYSKIKPRKKSKAIEYYVKLGKSRNEAIRLIYENGGYSMKQIADYYGIHYSTVSRAVNARCKI